MKIYKKYAIIGLLAIPSPFALMAQSTQEMNLSTPKPITPTWEDERDLIVLFDSAADKLNLANQVMNLSLDVNNSLTPVQRYDGLTIAGHTFWTFAQYDHCIVCFNGAVSLNISDSLTADSARMLGQSHFFKGEYDLATNAYLMCYNISKQIEAAGGANALADMVVIMLVDSAKRSENTELVYSITDSVLADTTLREVARTQCLRLGSQAALAAQNNEKARLYLNTLLNEYPDFGFENGDRILAELDLIRANGFSIENRDPEAVNAIAAIVQDERYIGLGNWTTAVELLAGLSEEADDMQAANNLRLWAVDQVDVKSNELDLNDPNAQVLLRLNKSIQLNLLLNAERGYEKTHQYQKQAQILDRIVSDYADIRPNTTQLAINKLSSLAQRNIMP